MRSRLILLTLGACCLVLGAGATASAQVATLLLQEQGPVPNGPAGLTITAINNSAVNHNGGYAFMINTTDGTNTVGHAWGNATGGPGAVLRSEGTFGDYEQTSYESFFGFSDAGMVAYSAISNNTASGGTSLDGVWLDDDFVAVEELPYPYIENWYWSFGSRPGTTADGVPYFVGGITGTIGGSTANRGLFYGLATTPLLIGEGFIGGLPDPITTGSGAVSFDYRFSAMGTHYIAESATETGSTTNDNCMVIDGNVIMSGGANVVEGTLIPVGIGGLPGEPWDNFDFAGITEDGTYMFTGDTDGDVATDEFIALNGVILFREGQSLDGEVLSGSIEGAYLNEQGNFAYIWDIQNNSLEALFLGDQLLLKEGDAVDLDGDLQPDPGATITDFTGISSLTLSDRNPDGSLDIYFVADVNFPDPALRPVVEDPILAVSDEAGIAADDIVNGAVSPDRVVLEGAFVLKVPAAIPVFLASFDVTPDVAAVDIAWNVAIYGDVGEFQLTARQDGEQWQVLFEATGEGRYAARDEADRLAAGGAVTYSLYHRSPGEDWRLLGNQTVQLRAVPLRTRLEGAYPNPFNPMTKVAFTLDRTQSVRIAIYDMSGQQVRVLAQQVFDAGHNEVTWQGNDEAGRAVSSGTYLVRLETDSAQESQKLMLVR